MSHSDNEETLYLQIKLANLPLPTREFKFHFARKWRLDFAWIEHLLAVEVEGGIYRKGRHVRPRGFTNDCEKYNEVALNKYCLLRVTPHHIKNGKALQWIERALHLK